MRNLTILITLFILIALIVSLITSYIKAPTPTPTPTPAPSPSPLQMPTPTPTMTSAQLSTIELSEPYLLPKSLVNSAFEIYIDGTLWERAEELSDFGPNDQVYVLVEDSEGQSSIRFGDGQHGARLPSHSSKVVATYRSGDDADGDNGDL